MRLKRLTIDRLPGIDQPFEIESAGAGVHIIFGPNAIGKSSICRAVEALYWDDRGPTERAFVKGQFELDGKTWRAERDGSRRRWRCEGEDKVPQGIPASHNHRCFFLRLRDLIDPSLDGTQDIASEIRRQMLGGFDLNRIVEDLFPRVSSRQRRSQRDQYNDAAEKVGAAEGTQLGLQRRADELGQLRKKREAAFLDARRLPSVKRAIGLASRTKAHAHIVEEIRTLPDALANLTGREVKEIERLQNRVNELKDETRHLERKRDAATGAKRDSRLPSNLNKSELAVWQRKAEELERLELELQTARTHRAQCRKELDDALSALDGGDVGEVALTVRQHGRIFEFLRAAENHRARKNAIEERLSLLAHLDQGEDVQSQLETLRSAVDALRRWLRAPDPETFRDRLWARRGWVMFGVAMMVAGAGLAVFVAPWFGLLLAAGAGVMVPVTLLRGTKAASDTRANAQHAYASLDVEAPDAWKAGSVESRLRNLEIEVAAIDSRLQRAGVRDVERQDLNNRLKGLDRVETSLDERRENLLRNVKLNSVPPDAELVDFARALDQLRATRIKHEGASGKVDNLEKRHAQLLSYLADVLQHHGEPMPEDATEAKVYLVSISGRNDQLVKALDDESQVDAQLKRNSNERDTVLNSIQKIYAEASLNDGDVSGLTELLKLLPQYRELKENAKRLKAQIDLDREELANAGEAELADYDMTMLDRLQHDFSAAENEALEFLKEITTTEMQVNEAKSGSSLQNLITRREDARAALQDLRDKALLAEAGRFLVNAVEKEYEQNQKPRVFERAAGHFSNFTHHGYELHLSRDTKSPRLFAVDLPSGDDRELNELSDGTRAQLLLAARMAFAEEVEQGRTLPLFLDEALDQSDPARFEAIARSLGRLANDQGRQIFYLTSDPQDLHRFRQALEAENCVVAAEIDLGLIRGIAASVTEPTTLQVPRRPAVPAPDGASVEEYGVRLRVPAFAPALGSARQHFFYVLPDDLNLLHDFMVNGIKHAGQWETVSGTPLAERLRARSITSREIESRLSLLEVFCEAWNQGRSRGVDRDVLVQSGALSDRYLDDVVAIARELGGDPEKLLAALREKNDNRLRGFRRSNADDLEGHLRDNGYLDDRPVLGESELKLRALTRPPANELPDGVASNLLSRWWIWATKMSDGGA